MMVKVYSKSCKSTLKSMDDISLKDPKYKWLFDSAEIKPNNVQFAVAQYAMDRCSTRSANSYGLSLLDKGKLRCLHTLGLIVCIR